MSDTSPTPLTPTPSSPTQASGAQAGAAHGRTTRVVALTLLGAAAIVPALLARRMLDANATLASAEKLRSSLESPEPRASGDGAEPDAADPNRRIESALAPPRPVSSADQVRFFSRDEIEQANATQKQPPKVEGNLLPPIGVSASPASSDANTPAGNPNIGPVFGKANFGTRVTWQDNPMNPAGALVRHQVYRWSERERPTAVYTSPAEKLGGGDDAPGQKPAKPHEFHDSAPCQGSRVTYAVRTVQLDRLEGVEVRRSALSESVTVDVPVIFELEALGYADANDPTAPAGSDPSAAGATPIIRLAVTDRRAAPAARREIRVLEPEDLTKDIGLRDLGIETGWTLVSLERDVRQETVELGIPVFNADGSRKLESGIPVTTPRSVTRKNAYPVLRLRDRCGNEKTLRVPAGRAIAPGK